MKLSNYCFFYESDDDILAYNARTNAMAVMKQEDYEKVVAFVNGIEIEDVNLLNDLKYGGFLIADEVDELEILRYEMYQARFSGQTLGLTIAPTSDCNFRCPYCYEKDVLHTQRMTDETTEQLVKFIENRANQIKYLNVTWYGGEPLLEYNRIIELSEKFLDICKRKNVKYFAGMVTNGYLLTKERMKKLIECNVKTVQITLDGTKEIHDSRRYLKNKVGTFEKIMENLKSFQSICLIENFPKISIRINIDRSNKKDAFELLNYIANSGMSSYVRVYIAGVYDPEDINYKETLKTEEYQMLKLEFMEACNNKGMPLAFNSYYPKRIMSSCCCDRMDSFVIDAYGNLYKCWEEIGNKECCIGTIYSQQNMWEMPPFYYKYMTQDATLSESCKGCKILPICMGGGCPHRKRIGKNNVSICEGVIKMFDMNMEHALKLLGWSVIKKITID